MLLEDAESKSQVIRALAAGDEELRNDIEEKLEESTNWWNRDGRLSDYLTPEEDQDYGDYLITTAFIDEVISESPGRYDLSVVPRDDVEAQLTYDSTHPVTMRNGAKKWGPFVLTENADWFSFPVWETYSAYFPEDKLPDNAEMIPTDMARAFWEGLEGSVEWEQTDRVEENTGTVSTKGSLYLTSDEDTFTEWCRDLISEYTTNLAKKDPAAARETLYKSVKDVDAALGEKLRLANLPDEEMLDLVTKWFSGEDDEREEATEALRDYFASLEGDAGVEREVLGEWTQADLRAMGITKGPLYEEAPWKLIKLRPSDLRLEGTLMRHCVGDSGMGYTRAVKDGEIEIWSLRSRNNKPRFTLEVDGDFFSDALLPDERGKAIKQLKGKANRRPGFAAARDQEVKFRDEVLFWKKALTDMNIDPFSVEDFDATSHLIVHENPSGDMCVGFDLPYRPLRRRREALRKTSRRR